jgi:hypothetical protein
MSDEHLWVEGKVPDPATGELKKVRIEVSQEVYDHILKGGIGDYSIGGLTRKEATPRC